MADASSSFLVINEVTMTKIIYVLTTFPDFIRDLTIISVFFAFGLL